MFNVTHTMISNSKRLSCRRKHIAVILPNLTPGGLQRATLRVATGLIEHGHTVDLLPYTIDVSLAKEIPEGARIFVLDYNQPVYDENKIKRLQPRPRFKTFTKLKSWIVLACLMLWHLRKYSNFRVRTALSLATYIYREQPDFLLPQLPTRHDAITMLARRMLNEYPTVIPVVHSHMRYENERHISQTELLCAMAKHTITVSNGVAGGISRRMGIPESDITAIHSPVWSESIDHLSQQTPSHVWFQDSDVPILLSVGRLAPTKDFATLIRAFSHVRQRQNCRLIILGEGQERASLEELISRLVLGNDVSLPGFVNNPYAYMRRASLFVLTSTREGLPTVLIEALACGCSCVSTNCNSGPSEILKGGEFGELVDVGDEVALSQAIELALTRQPDKERLKSRARDFSMNRAIQKYEQVFERVSSC